MISLKSDGTVWTWGNNQYGQLGNGDIENYNTGTPQQVIAPEYDENNQVILLQPDREVANGQRVG